MKITSLPVPLSYAIPSLAYNFEDRGPCRKRSAVDSGDFGASGEAPVAKAVSKDPSPLVRHPRSLIEFLAKPCGLDHPDRTRLSATYRTDTATRLLDFQSTILTFH